MRFRFFGEMGQTVGTGPRRAPSTSKEDDDVVAA